MGNNGLDANEIDSNAEEDEPLELYDAEEEEEVVEWQGPQHDVLSEGVDGTIFLRSRFSKRSAHPQIAASLSVRKNVSISSTHLRI